MRTPRDGTDDVPVKSKIALGTCAVMAFAVVACWPRVGRSQVPPAPPDLPAEPAPTAESTASPPASPSPQAVPTALPLGTVRAGAWTFTPSAQVRLRGEGRVNNYLPAVRDDEYFVTSRARVAIDARWNRLRLFAQAQDVRNLGDTQPGNDGGGGFGIHQGFAEVGFDHGYFRLGRQEINYGTERFLGALDWLSSARSFDGVRVHLTPTPKVELDMFGAIIRGENAFQVGMERHTSAGDYFASAQLAYLVSPALRLEANYFYRHDGATAAAPTQHRDIQSPTIRASGNVRDGLLRYDVEAGVQTGFTQLGRHFAYAFAGDVTARLGAAGRPSVDAGASYATGRSANGNVDEFENFFPTNHKFYGLMDLFGLRNVIEGHVGISHRIASPNVTIAARAFEFFQQTTNGASRWSNAGGASVGTGTGGSRHVGAEADFWVSYKPLEFLAVNGGYSLFVPGSGAESMGRTDPQHWMWLQIDVHTP